MQFGIDESRKLLENLVTVATRKSLEKRMTTRMMLMGPNSWAKASLFSQRPQPGTQDRLFRWEIYLVTNLKKETVLYSSLLMIR